MASYTPNYNLYLPSRNDSNIEVDTSLSDNFSQIDTSIKNVNDTLSSQLAESMQNLNYRGVAITDYLSQIPNYATYSNLSSIPDWEPAFAKALSDLGAGARIFVPPSINYNLATTVNVTQSEVIIFSTMKSEYKTSITGTTPNMNMFNVSNYSFAMMGIQLVGDANLSTSAFSATIIGVNIDRSDGSGNTSLANLDAEFYDCGFSKLLDAAKGNGMNVYFHENLFSTCVHGITVTKYPGADCRGIRVINNRFHSMGYNDSTLASGLSSYCVSIDSYAYGNEIRDNFIDWCKDFYHGPIDRTKISNNQMYWAYGDGITINVPTGSNLVTGWEIKGNMFISDLPTDTTKPTMNYGINVTSNTGAFNNGQLSDNTISHSRKEAIYIAFGNALEIKDNFILNPNKFANVDGSIYDGISINGGSGNDIYNNRVRSSVPNSTKPRNGIYNTADYTRIDKNWIENFTTDISNTATHTTVKTTGTATPATGTWGQGSVIENTAPAASGNMGWVCVIAGSPGTWKTYGTIGS